MMHQHPAYGRDARANFELWMTCADCGDVVVRAETCELQTWPTHHAVAFACSSCGRRAAIPVTPEDVTELVAAGFVSRQVAIAGELLERRLCGSPLTWDDLLSFHEALHDADDVVRLAAADRVTSR